MEEETVKAQVHKGNGCQTQKPFISHIFLSKPVNYVIGVETHKTAKTHFDDKT